MRPVKSLWTDFSRPLTLCTLHHSGRAICLGLAQNLQFHRFRFIVEVVRHSLGWDNDLACLRLPARYLSITRTLTDGKWMRRLHSEQRSLLLLNNRMLWQHVHFGERSRLHGDLRDLLRSRSRSLFVQQCALCLWVRKSRLGRRRRPYSCLW